MKTMKKFFAILAIVATMIFAISCRESKPVVSDEDVVAEQVLDSVAVDSLVVAVDSVATEDVVAE